MLNIGKDMPTTESTESPATTGSQQVVEIPPGVGGGEGQDIEDVSLKAPGEIDPDKLKPAKAQTAAPPVPPAAGAGNADTDDNNRGGEQWPPNGPRGPEGPPSVDRIAEYETSPERGRSIAKEIIRLEATLSYTERYRETSGILSGTNPDIYKPENGTYLDQLYLDLQDYTQAVRKKRNQRDPWNPKLAFRKIAAAMERFITGETEPEANQQLRRGVQRERGERPGAVPTISVTSLNNRYMRREALPPDVTAEQVKNDLGTWFQEARALGLLDRADAIFTSVYKGIVLSEISETEAQEHLQKATILARKSIEGLFRDNQANPEVKRLEGIGEAYANRTRDLFQVFLDREQFTPVEGDFKYNEEAEDEGDTETYWQPGHYPKMYIVIAKTKDQLRKAADSFLRMVTKGSLGKSPDELYQHFDNFKDTLGQVGSQLEEAGVVEPEFMEDLRQEMEARGFIFGADYSAETYNPKSFNQFMMAMALHEGPQRWVRLARSGNGGVGSMLWKFDYDPRITFFYNPGGSRGQIANDTVTQHYLTDQIKNILIEEEMGVGLKNYDPRGMENNIIAFQRYAGQDLNNMQDYDNEWELSNEDLAVAIEIGRVETELRNGISFAQLSERDQEFYLKVLAEPDSKLPEEERLKFLRSPEKFKENLERIGKHQPVEEFKNMYEGFGDGGTHIINFRRFGSLESNNKELFKRLPVGIRRSIIIGKVQLMLRGHEGKNRSQLLGVVKKLVESGQLTKKDENIWKTTYDQAKVNFDVAFQMEGASGEKVRKGGGVFFVDRKDTNGKRFVDNIPCYQAEKFVLYAVNRIKVQYANNSAIDRDDAVKRIRAYAITQIRQNGFDAKLQFPKINYKTNVPLTDPTYGDVLDTGALEVINFDQATASDKVLNKWTNHTYLHYQQENRHMLTNPDVVRQAKQLRAGLVRPDQVDNLASLLLLIDPTLKRVRRINDTDMPEGMGAGMQFEIMLFEAAVESSNIGYWDIMDDLSAAFLPNDGNAFQMRTGYNGEDEGGISRFIIRMRQYVASQPWRFARRYAAEIARLPVHVSSMPAQWGQEGLMGAIEMFEDPIGELAHQKEASQFAITKFVEQMRLGNLLFEALVGHVDSERGFSIEGLFEKPTNNSDKLVKYWGLMKNAKTYPEAENEFFYAVMESFDRLWIVLKLARAIDTDTRNAAGVHNWDRKEVLDREGKPNKKILEQLASDRDVGSSRHLERKWFNSYINWLLAPGVKRGQETYPSEVAFYKFLREPYFYVAANGHLKQDENGRTWADWLFDKMGR